MNSGSKMDKIRAPYNFVPLSDTVVFPDDEWAQTAAIDVPFRDGICGTLDLQLEALTPLMVRGTADKQGERELARMLRLPLGEDGAMQPVVPGSAVRGMLRNVVEIASFGKLSRVNDHRYSIRDLRNRPAYVDHMAALIRPEGTGRQARKEYMPLVDAGWLVRREGQVVIEPCHFAKISYEDLAKLAADRGRSAFRPGEPQPAADKYRAWGAPKGEAEALSVEVNVRRLRPRTFNGRGFISGYGKATPGSQQTGCLVFTGQPTRYRVESSPKEASGHYRSGRGRKNKAKRHDFVFYGDAGKALSVSEQVFADFEFIHSDSGQQRRLVGRKPNAEWAFWKTRFDEGRCVPVFFLREANGDVRAMGLAMMFRLAYRKTTRDAVANAQPDAFSDKPDLAELLFGAVGRGSAARNERTVVARRGRVSFGLMRPVGAVKEAKDVLAVLAAPKPSYYPNYIEHGEEYGAAPPDKRSYATFMDDDVRARGWKRYRLQGVRTMPVEKDKVATRFRPVAAGSRFAGRLRVHNLRPVELGALLWALDFGGCAECFHALGMGRPLGYGRVRLTVQQHSLKSNDRASVTSLAECRAQFVQYMETQLAAVERSWWESDQVRELLELAKVVPESRQDDVRYMVLGRGRGSNEFENAKDEALALAPSARRERSS